MKMASARTSRIACMASTFAFTIFQCGHKCAVTLQLLVPPAVTRREGRADIHFVDGRVELNPGEVLSECARVSGEKSGKVFILKIAYPAGHAKVTEVNDWHHISFTQVCERLVCERPVVMVRP